MSKKEKKSIGCGGIILICLVGFIAFAMMQNESSKPVAEKAKKATGEAEAVSEPKSKTIATQTIPEPEAKKPAEAPVPKLSRQKPVEVPESAGPVYYPTPTFKEIAADRNLWPNLIQLNAAISHEIELDGQIVGEQSFESGTKILVKKLSPESGSILADVRGTEIEIDHAKTNLIDVVHQLIKDNVDAELAREERKRMAAIETRQREKKLAEEQAERKRKADRQFSIFKGHHVPTKKILEANLKDPDSLEIIETRSWAMPGKITVKTKYRAKNSFGGYVIEQLNAEFDYEGRLIRIHEN